MPPKTVYLAGPMRGHDNFNFPAFYEAEAVLKGLGYVVVNPARNGNQNLNGHLVKDAQAVARVDFIALLPGWQDSRGAQLELLMADYVGTPAYLYHGLSIGKFVRVVPQKPLVVTELVDDDEIVDRAENPIINTSRAEYAAEDALKRQQLSAAAVASLYGGPLNTGGGLNTGRLDFRLPRRGFPLVPLAEDWPQKDLDVAKPAKTRFEELLALMQELHDRKKSDYTAGNADILSNYRQSGNLAHISLAQSIFARLSEKVIRISSILKKGGQTSVKDETVMDTCLDLAIISLLLRIAFEEQQEETDARGQAAPAVAA